MRREKETWRFRENKRKVCLYGLVREDKDTTIIPKFASSSSHFPTLSQGLNLNWKTEKSSRFWDMASIPFCSSPALHFFRRLCLPAFSQRVSSELLRFSLSETKKGNKRHTPEREKVHNNMTRTKDFFPRLTEIPSHVQQQQREHKKNFQSLFNFNAKTFFSSRAHVPASACDVFIWGVVELGLGYMRHWDRKLFLFALCWISFGCLSLMSHALTTHSKTLQLSYPSSVLTWILWHQKGIRNWTFSLSNLIAGNFRVSWSHMKGNYEFSQTRNLSLECVFDYISLYNIAIFMNLSVFYLRVGVWKIYLYFSFLPVTASLRFN